MAIAAVSTLSRRAPRPTACRQRMASRAWRSCGVKSAQAGKRDRAADEKREAIEVGNGALYAITLVIRTETFRQNNLPIVTHTQHKCASERATIPAQHCSGCSISRRLNSLIRTRYHPRTTLLWDPESGCSLADMPTTSEMVGRNDLKLAFWLAYLYAGFLACWLACLLACLLVRQLVRLLAC